MLLDMSGGVDRLNKLLKEGEDVPCDASALVEKDSLIYVSEVKGAISKEVTKPKTYWKQLNLSNGSFTPYILSSSAHYCMFRYNRVSDQAQSAATIYMSVVYYDEIDKEIKVTNEVVVSNGDFTFKHINAIMAHPDFPNSLYNDRNMYWGHNGDFQIGDTSHYICPLLIYRAENGTTFNSIRLYVHYYIDTSGVLHAEYIDNIFNMGGINPFCVCPPSGLLQEMHRLTPTKSLLVDQYYEYLSSSGITATTGTYSQPLAVVLEVVNDNLVVGTPYQYAGWLPSGTSRQAYGVLTNSEKARFRVDTDTETKLYVLPVDNAMQVQETDANTVDRKLWTYTRTINKLNNSITVGNRTIFETVGGYDTFRFGENSGENALFIGNKVITCAGKKNGSTWDFYFYTFTFDGTSITAPSKLLAYSSSGVSAQSIGQKLNSLFDRETGVGVLLNCTITNLWEYYLTPFRVDDEGNITVGTTYAVPGAVSSGDLTYMGDGYYAMFLYDQNQSPVTYMPTVYKVSSNLTLTAVCTVPNGQGANVTRAQCAKLTDIHYYVSAENGTYAYIFNKDTNKLTRWSSDYTAYRIQDFGDYLIGFHYVNTGTTGYQNVKAFKINKGTTTTANGIKSIETLMNTTYYITGTTSYRFNYNCVVALVQAENVAKNLKIRGLLGVCTSSDSDITGENNIEIAGDLEVEYNEQETRVRYTGTIPTKNLKVAYSKNSISSGETDIVTVLDVK